MKIQELNLIPNPKRKKQETGSMSLTGKGINIVFV